MGLVWENLIWIVKGIVSIVIGISISFHVFNNSFSGTTKVTASLHPTTTWWMWRRTQLLEQRWPAASQANRTLSPLARSMPLTPAPLWRRATTATAWPALSSSMSGGPSHSSPSPLRSTLRLWGRAPRSGCQWSLSPDDDADPFLVLGWLGSRITTGVWL